MKNMKKTMKERLLDLHDRGHCLDVSPVRRRGNKLLCRFRNDATGGDLKLISAGTLADWEEEAEIHNAN